MNKTGQKENEAAAGNEEPGKRRRRGRSRKRERPTREQLTAELKRQNYRKSYWRIFRSTVGGLLIVAAAAILVAVMLLPVLQIYGTSMTETLNNGDIVVSVKGSDFETGDVIAFYYNNKILVKRVIASAGDWIDIDEDGTVTVNWQTIDEPYVNEKAKGECNIELPYQVPDGKVFVMGDHRTTSIDSRNTAVGCVADEQIVGRIVFRIWPLSGLGTVN